MTTESDGSLKLLEGMAWLEANARKLAWGVAAVAVIAIAVFYFNYRQAQREQAAAQALGYLRTQAGRTGSGSAELLKLKAEHAGTAAARRAGFLAAGALFAEGKVGEARAAFEQFVAAHPDDPLTPQAAYGVAACQEAEKNIAAALAAHQGVVARFPNDGVATQSKLAIGRIYESRGQYAEALKLYQETTRAGALSAWHADFASRRDEILRQHPQLATTNAPVAPTP